MAIRDFVDDRGVSWKVWPVTPETAHHKTPAEDYLAEYQAGWLCFESASERRRLADYPDEWDRLTDEELRALLRVAAVVPERMSLHLPPEPPPS